MTVALVAACYGYYSGPDGVGLGDGAAADSSVTSEADIVMRDTVFVPAVDTVLAGRVVTWENRDSIAHTVTTVPGSPDAFDSGVLRFRETFKHVFAAPGSYPYYDRLNGTPDSGMRGTVVVR